MTGRAVGGFKGFDFNTYGENNETVTLKWSRRFIAISEPLPTINRGNVNAFHTVKAKRSQTVYSVAFSVILVARI